MGLKEISVYFDDVTCFEAMMMRMIDELERIRQEAAVVH